MVISHMVAKHAAISAPAPISTQANGWKSLIRYHELISMKIARNGSAMIEHLSQMGLTYAWVNASPTIKKMNVSPNRWIWETRTSVEMDAPVSSAVTFLRLS